LAFDWYLAREILNKISIPHGLVFILSKLVQGQIDEDISVVNRSLNRLR